MQGRWPSGKRCAVGLTRMAMLERLIRHLQARREVWFATHLEVAEAWLAQEPVS